VKHVVQFSTGVASAEIAWRLVGQHGPADVILLSADTLVEDPDNWRFAREVNDRLGCEWVILADGRTPMEAGRDARVVPNNRMAVCSRILKRELLRRHIDEHCDPANTVIYLGFDWTETDRLKAARPHWAPYRIAAPLIDPPYVSKPDLLATFRARGIEPPDLYRYGLPHANCGGCCVRGGQAQWQRVLTFNRDRYLEWEAEEEESRALLGKDVSILRDRIALSPHQAIAAGEGWDKLRPLTLRQFRERIERQPGLFDADDWGACGCDMAGSTEPAAPAGAVTA
jgi:3'-phosphoadenosine 5'-phosphosulfate sulfotransferase (PAPS reductase)/FAD synthetase